MRIEILRDDEWHVPSVRPVVRPLVRTSNCLRPMLLPCFEGFAGLDCIFLVKLAYVGT